jgi:hypothetical protein
VIHGNPKNEIASFRAFKLRKPAIAKPTEPEKPSPDQRLTASSRATNSGVDAEAVGAWDLGKIIKYTRGVLSGAEWDAPPNRYSAL